MRAISDRVSNKFFPAYLSENFVCPVSFGSDETYEDSTITDEGLRRKYFGQNDHVRMYSKRGFVERLESVGFVVNQYGIDYFGAEVFALNGIHPRSVLYIVNK